MATAVAPDFEEGKIGSIPAKPYYAWSHEWVRLEANGSVTIDVSDHTQETPGDVVFIKLSELGEALTAGQEAGVVESVKTASGIYSPIDGEVIAISEALADAPGDVNNDPYAFWFLELKPSNSAGLDKLLDATSYQATADAKG